MRAQSSPGAAPEKNPAGARARARLPLAAPLLLVVVALLLLGGIYSLSNLSRTTAWLRHTDEVRVAIGGLRSTILGAESGMRGYLVTGAPEFLAGHERAVGVLAERFKRVRALTTDNPDQQERLGRLSRLIDARLELLKEQRAMFDRGGRGPTLTPLMLEGRRTMEIVRDLIDEMETEETRLDGVRQRAAFDRWRLTMILVVGGAFGSIVILGAAIMQRRAADARGRRAEDVARAIDGERHLLRAVLSGIEDGITLQDRSGKLVFANASGARLIGFPSPEALLAAEPAEIMGRFEVFDPDGKRLSPEQMPGRAVLSGRLREAGLLVRYRVRPEGEERWSSIRAYPIIDAGGALVQAINVFRDVTAEHREQERMRFLVRATEVLGASLDYEQTLAAVAEQAVPVLGDWCAVDIVEGDQIKRLAITHVDPRKVSLVAELQRRYPPDPQARTGVPEILRTGRPVLFETIPRDMLVAAAVDEQHLALIDGLQLCSFLGVPLKVGARTIGAISFAMAESSRHHTEKDVGFAQALADRAALAIENARLFQEAERASAALAVQLSDEMRRRREAEEASRFAETFVAILGHDLRNPLNAVSMTARLLQRKGNGDPKAVDRIVSSAARMSNMVGQLLDLTRSRLAGGITVDRKPVRVGAVVSEVLDELRQAHPTREIAWSVHGDDAALVDQDRFAQVVSNLVGNAVEHGDPSAPVSVTLGAKGDALVLVVHNAGPPIPPTILPVIFDPFRRTAARGPLARGLGLGLFISQQIVFAHGGTIDVQSTVGDGTTFTVHLPRLPVQKMSAAEGTLVS